MVKKVVRVNVKSATTTSQKPKGPVKIRLGFKKNGGTQVKGTK